MSTQTDPGAATAASGGRPAGFSVHLDVFEGPFDLLLSLIAKHKLDVTLVALSQVTDEFIGHIRAAGEGWDLGQASEFLVIAATLLDLKAARLLPSASVEDEEDLALLEARDLLFARLLQYRVYREAAGRLADRMTEQARRYPRCVGPDPAVRGLQPAPVLGVDAVGLAAVAGKVFRPVSQPTVPTDHLHAPRVSVRDQALLVAERLRRSGGASFAQLAAGCTGLAEVVARFLAVLELYREGVLVMQQAAPFAELRLRWAERPGRPNPWAADSWAVEDYGDEPPPDPPASAGDRPAAEGRTR